MSPPNFNVEELAMKKKLEANSKESDMFFRKVG
jgi:hypothetical protein